MAGRQKIVMTIQIPLLGQSTPLFSIEFGRRKTHWGGFFLAHPLLSSPFSCFSIWSGSLNDRCARVYVSVCMCGGEKELYFAANRSFSPSLSLSTVYTHIHMNPDNLSTSLKETVKYTYTRIHIHT